MKKTTLDQFEKDLESSFEKDTWVEVQDAKERHKAVAAAKMTKSERTNIRLSSEDLAGIKEKASEYGLGYQTLIASIVHRYVTGKLVDVAMRTV
jgi:predicted DNA binding CopG/RHH family protein